MAAKDVLVHQSMTKNPAQVFPPGAFIREELEARLDSAGLRPNPRPTASKHQRDHQRQDGHYRRHGQAACTGVRHVAGVVAEFRDGLSALDCCGA